MKKFFLVVVCLVVLVISTSCSGKFDRTKTDDIYCQIVLNDNRKINLRLDYDRAPITVDNFIDLLKITTPSPFLYVCERLYDSRWWLYYECRCC